MLAEALGRLPACGAAPAGLRLVQIRAGSFFKLKIICPEPHFLANFTRLALSHAEPQLSACRESRRADHGGLKHLADLCILDSARGTTLLHRRRQLKALDQ